MKFSFTKEALEVLRDCDSDERFFQRSLMRVRIGATAVKINQLQRVGQVKKNMKNVDLEGGTFEVENIIIAKDIKAAIKKPGSL